ncbi:MAG: VWA domain-containing protein [Candidatus Velthaea sp.]
MTFAHPLVLLATLCALGGFVWLVRGMEGRRAEDALAYSNLDFLERAAAARVPWGAIVLGAWTLALACVGVALAGPHIVAPVAVRDSALALCIDTSGSMAAPDIAPTRSAAALQAAATFIDAVPDGTRVALVAFASSAGVIMPAIDDKDALREGLTRVPAPNGGTAIGDALALAARALPAVRHRAVVLVTDGVNNSGSDPLTVAQTLARSGIVVYTVGIGTSGSGTLIPGTGEAADLDEESLRAIALTAHGIYVRASDADGLRARLRELAQTATRERRPVDASFPLAIAGGVIMIVATAGALTIGRYP